MRLLSNLLRRFIRQGTLRIRDADGKVHGFGNQLPGPDVAVHLHSGKLYNRLFFNPELYAAEAYMDGELTLENGAQIHDFLMLFSVNRAALYTYGTQKLMRRLWRRLRPGIKPILSGSLPPMPVTIMMSRRSSIVFSSTIKCNIPALIFEIPNATR